MLPALFVAHGSPMMAVAENAYTEFLRSWALDHPKPSAVVIFSAHWESLIQKVSRVVRYDTIHDFGGFPAALYQIHYPAPGEPALADAILQRFQQKGLTAQPDPSRGLDHGAWVVLRLLYPDADVPVVALSVNSRLAPADAFRIGRVLEPWRAQNVLVIGSGVTVHNFGWIQPEAREPMDWAVQFDDWVDERIIAWDTPGLFLYRQNAPFADRAVPLHGREHFYPLFYAMGSADQARRGQRLFQAYQYGSLSYAVWQFG
ncbi:4,5-DOPA dioxygenase extradiol-like protein [Sulfobacillus acidophilus TPY]|uniref:Extradiol ring-cleavage dioxygenase class III protein subunit B n=1 Tax=Sulfobacillus acidophilus (strain ATCC 700253 / DSM 10332 / NAL) TaxID=679936 RepID=G8TW37_SULAD|nr:4,5-DOPA dioxygenase extradiol-like protein [Sulfobacillus acidophilus TPY]AEW05964.1 Extradiol ring-cleavage dioxygenase class III protein subunit B [Sulfobacillus acidophilus DSM 10332]